MNQHNGNDNHDVALKVISDAVNESNEWTDVVPFILSNSPNDVNVRQIDMFSNGHLQPYSKELHFYPKYKPSDESVWKTLLKDLKR